MAKSKNVIEADYGDNCPTDPFEVSDADTMLAYLKGAHASTAPTAAAVG